MLESAAMKRVAALSLIAVGSFLALVTTTGTGCSSTLSQPFEQLKAQPITIHRLQNFEPPQAAAAPGVPGLPQIPPQINQWLGGAASLLPPGLIPPGLIPGSPAAPAAQDAPRFYNFRILGSMSVTDATMRSDILNLFGKESNFEAPRQSCMYAEFGFSIGAAMATGGPVAAPAAGGAPADILVSLSCDQVQMFNYGWPYGTKTGMPADTAKKVIAIVQKAFGG
jgi:hypothetical protein